MICKVEEYSATTAGEFELHMIGGFKDSKCYSTELCLEILCKFD